VVAAAAAEEEEEVEEEEARRRSWRQRMPWIGWVSGGHIILMRILYHHPAAWSQTRCSCLDSSAVWRRRTPKFR
jgi:hypothetical protein